MENTVDLLKIKIEKAKAELPEESRRAIDAIDWKTIILGMRAEKGYSYTQLEDLEIETELILCGLLSPENYPKELEKRMNIPKAQVDVLVNEMNEKIFKKIREELVKNIERKKISKNKETVQKINTSISDENPIESREELLRNIENPEPTKSITNYELGITNKNEENLKPITNYELRMDQKELPAGESQLQITNDELQNKDKVNPILAQKLGGSFKMEPVETDHSIENISKSGHAPYAKNADPYRLPPE